MNTRAIVQLITSIIAIVSLFGIHWIFSVTLLSTQHWTYTHGVLFTVWVSVFSVIQGLSFFFLFGVVNKDARESWKELFSCCSSKPNLLTHSNLLGTADKAIALSKELLNNRSHCEESVPNVADKNQQYSLKTNGNHTFNSSPIIQNNTVEDIHTASTETQVNKRKEGTSNQTETHVNKVKVRRYSTMKHHHHVEEFEITFEQQETDDESDHVCS